jgi:hypothetical protein
MMSPSLVLRVPTGTLLWAEGGSSGEDSVDNLFLFSLFPDFYHLKIIYKWY